MRQWDVERCEAVFRDMTRRFFGRRHRLDKSIVANVRWFLQSWLSDGIYDVNELEAALKQHFGADSRLFNSNFMLPSGFKVGVTATNITDASPFIFTNYNGVGHRRKDCGYRLVRPRDTEEEPYIWQA